MREWMSLGVWTAAFLAFELPAKDVFGVWPWYSLSRTVQLGIGWWWPISVYVAVFMFVLWGHFEFDWRVRYLLMVAALGVALVASHLIQKSL